MLKSDANYWANRGHFTLKDYLKYLIFLLKQTNKQKSNEVNDFIITAVIWQSSYNRCISWHKSDEVVLNPQPSGRRQGSNHCTTPVPIVGKANNKT